MYLSISRTEVDPFLTKRGVRDQAKGVSECGENIPRFFRFHYWICKSVERSCMPFICPGCCKAPYREDLVIVV